MLLCCSIHMLHLEPCEVKWNNKSLCKIAADLNKPFAKVTIANLRRSKPNSSMAKMKSLQNSFYLTSLRFWKRDKRKQINSANVQRKITLKTKYCPIYSQMDWIAFESFNKAAIFFFLHFLIHKNHNGFLAKF